MLARSPGNMTEVTVSQDQTVTCMVIIICLMSFISLKQILEVMFGNAGIRSGSATVVLKMTSVGSKVRSSKLHEFSKCLS